MDLAPPRRLVPDVLDLQQVPVLSLDQIRAIRARNDYVERPPALEPGLPPGPRRIPRSQSLHQHAPPPPLSQASTATSLSRSSTASEARGLPGLARSRSSLLPVRSQPKAQLKPPPGPPGAGRHLRICERCGRCKCAECGARRGLPACWLCDQRCLCSAEAVLDHATCLCLVKGLFYHCSADDEDTCADRPCSCGPARRCARWGAMAALALCLPCLCCYPPAKLCLSAAQLAYDRATRPGCRCRHSNTVCRKLSAPGPAPGHAPKPLEKPV